MFSLNSAWFTFIENINYFFLLGCDLVTRDGKCFSYFSSTALDWFDARARCQSWGGELASITSGVEVIALRLAGGPFPTRYCWIGLNDIEEDGAYVWSDGNNSYYRNWVDNYFDYDCVITHIYNNLWYDHPCSDLNIGCYYCGNLPG